MCMWCVFQIVGEKIIKWFGSDDFDFLCGFCQYMIDSSCDGGLEDFWVFWTNGKDTKKKKLYEFCDVQEIKKRTFDERMAGSDIDKRTMKAWANSLIVNR